MFKYKLKYKFLLPILSLFYCCHLFAMGSKYASSPYLDTATNVNLTRYSGKWYEIVRKPLSFETDCVGVTAEYSSRKDGKINVKNTCRKLSCDGHLSVSHGVATAVDNSNLAKLKVSFFWPFQSDYWILELNPEYDYAVVGSPDRRYFWILSRTPSLPETVVEAILAGFQAKGFDFTNLIKTPSCPESPTQGSPTSETSQLSE